MDFYYNLDITSKRYLHLRWCSEQLCQKTSECQWFTFNEAQSRCLLFADCPSLDETCADCLSGESTCKGINMVFLWQKHLYWSIC